MKDISNQVVFITGASSGIGAALAEILAHRYSGVKLILTARNQAKLATVASQCQKLGAEVIVIPADLADSQQVQNLAQKAVDSFDKIDVLVNNAGYGQMGPIELVPPTAVQEQFAVNFYAPLFLSQACIPVMREQGGGRIINISSLAGVMAFPAAGLYSCSKFALEALSDVLRMELTGFKIRVSIIEFGPVRTNFFQVAWDKLKVTIPHPEQTIYSPVFTSINSIDTQLEALGWSAAQAAEVIVKTIQKNNPPPRIMAATGGNILTFFLNKVFPTWVKDEFWKRFYNIHKVEQQWRRNHS
ncbi:MAG: SDR family oxidoreductase [Cyanobacteria bacterium J083]|nr:MAG: SDR family oxidoreductase [Cyanobacteria bacterium J083]